MILLPNFSRIYIRRCLRIVGSNRTTCLMRKPLKIPLWLIEKHCWYASWNRSPCNRVIKPCKFGAYQFSMMKKECCIVHWYSSLQTIICAEGEFPPFYNSSDSSFQLAVKEKRRLMFDTNALLEVKSIRTWMRCINTSCVIVMASSTYVCFVSMRSTKTHLNKVWLRLVFPSFQTIVILLVKVAPYPCY